METEPCHKGIKGATAGRRLQISLGSNMHAFD